MSDDRFINRRALQLAAEAECLRKPQQEITEPMVKRAAEIVAVREAVDVAGEHGHPFLAWRLQRLVSALRNMPIAEEEQS